MVFLSLKYQFIPEPIQTYEAITTTLEVEECTASPSTSTAHESVHKIYRKGNIQCVP